MLLAWKDIFFNWIGHSNRDHAISSKKGAWSALFSNLSKSGLENYVVKQVFGCLEFMAANCV